MEKDIEKILDSMVVPEMEYVKTKAATEAYEAPEVVLPKTRAEMYREAKGRLDQKTLPVSRTFDGKKPKRPAKKQKAQSGSVAKTVELFGAQTPVTAEKSDKTDKTEKSESLEALKKRIGNLRRIVEEPKWVGSADELVPFAWRNPLRTDMEKPTKTYRTASGMPQRRAMFLPVPHKNNRPQ